MLQKWIKKCWNYETISYIICGVLTTAVDFVAYAVFRKMGAGVGVAQALSWFAAVCFAYVSNKLVVFKSHTANASELFREAGLFLSARVFSGIVTWVLMVVLVKLGGDRGMIYELFCKMMSSAANLILNYIFSKIWVFKKQPEKG